MLSSLQVHWLGRRSSRSRADQVMYIMGIMPNLPLRRHSSPMHVGDMFMEQLADKSLGWAGKVEDPCCSVVVGRV